MRVHDPSGVATNGVALWSAGHSRFRSARVVMAFARLGLRPPPLADTPTSRATAGRRISESGLTASPACGTRDGSRD
jgi:hypothetical protein